MSRFRRQPRKRGAIALGRLVLTAAKGSFDYVLRPGENLRMKSEGAFVILDLKAITNAVLFAALEADATLADV